MGWGNFVLDTGPERQRRAMKHSSIPRNTSMRHKNLHSVFQELAIISATCIYPFRLAFSFAYGIIFSASRANQTTEHADHAETLGVSVTFSGFQLSRAIAMRIHCSSFFSLITLSSHGAAISPCGYCPRVNPHTNYRITSAVHCTFPAFSRTRSMAAPIWGRHPVTICPEPVLK